MIDSEIPVGAYSRYLQNVHSDGWEKVLEKEAERYEKKYPVLVKRYFRTKDDRMVWVVKHTNQHWQLWKEATGPYSSYQDPGHSISIEQFLKKS